MVNRFSFKSNGFEKKITNQKWLVSLLKLIKSIREISFFQLAPIKKALKYGTSVLIGNYRKSPNIIYSKL